MKNRQLITASLSVMFLLAAGVSSSRFLWATEEQPTQPVEAPPQRIPLGLYNDFTLQNAIPVYYWYRDDSQERKNPIIFTKEEVNTNLEKIAKRESHYFGSPDLHLYQACEKYKDDIHSSFFHKKKVAIIGSSTSWYESVVLSYGGSPTTISPYKITNEDARIHVLTPEEYAKNPQQFDAVIAVGSIQNTGLGRYGDAINPNADCLAMEQFQS
ncbi:MAG: hypothetical protein JWO53_705, partial [Chlamydiia bacterium]|nr:hypothetical protein [Chlamydiia bacterium]